MKSRSTIILGLVLFIHFQNGILFAQPELKNAARVERNVIFGMYSGLALLMDVYYPETPNGIGIVEIPGSGWTRPLSYDARVLHHQGHVKEDGEPLLAAGYTVFAINHRAVPRFTFPSQVEDVQRAVRFIRFHSDKYGINPDKIGAIGGSSGGHLVSMLGLLNGDEYRPDGGDINQVNAKVQCVVARATPTTFIDLDSSENFLGVRGKERRMVGSIEYNIAKEASPISHVTPDDPPMLLVHGDADSAVPFYMSELLLEKLQEVGVVSKLIPVKGGEHGATFGGKRPPNFRDEYVKWFDEHLR